MVPEQGLPSLHALISAFLAERRDAKLEKLAADDARRAEVSAQFELEAWVADASRRVAQIQAVTHSLKAIHPDARGSSLYCEPASLAPLDAVGSHCLGATFDGDVVGNAAALDVNKFLQLRHRGRSLLDLCIDADAELAATLCPDIEQARAWMAAFASLVQPRGRLSSHTLAKQLYWLVDADVHDDASYHLLAPLYPTSLVHRVYQTVQAHRFGDDMKAARVARDKGLWHPQPVHEYIRLAAQKLGGTKPQNISQLNSERRGRNLLLASAPPEWTTREVRPPLRVSSMFDAFARRPLVRAAVRRLREFLIIDPARNISTRQRVSAEVDTLLDELVMFSAEVWTLESGWAAGEECRLPAEHCQWLDPQACTDALIDDLSEAIAGDFARWLNARLRDPLPFGDDDYREWRARAQAVLRWVEPERVIVTDGETEAADA